MNRAEIIERLRFIASLDMAAQSYQKLVLDLAEQLDLEEARLSKDRARKLRVTSTEIPRKDAGNSTEVPASRVLDITKPSLPNLDIKSPLSPLPSKPTSVQPEGFEQFWEIYPKRAGNADKKPALKAFNAAIKRASLETILWGAGKYSDECKQRGKVGTEYVKQARTWLNADGWTEYEFSSVSSASSPVAAGVHIKAGCDEWDAWEAHYLKTKGKKPPRDSSGGWYFPTPTPPQEQVA